MYRVYVGNLDQAVDEGTLRGLFEEHGIAIGTILKKKNYAFIDCADQNNVERAINQLNGKHKRGVRERQAWKMIKPAFLESSTWPL